VRVDASIVTRNPTIIGWTDPCSPRYWDGAARGTGRRAKRCPVTRGKPDQNAFIERFEKTYRNEVLNTYVFDTIEQVQEITETWLREYNEERPHDSLGRVPPLTFLPRRSTVRESTCQLCP
jgi:transposase InsO family protein